MFGLPAAFSNLQAALGTGLPTAGLPAAFSNAAMGVGVASIPGIPDFYAQAASVQQALAMQQHAAAVQQAAALQSLQSQSLQSLQLGGCANLGQVFDQSAYSGSGTLAAAAGSASSAGASPAEYRDRMPASLDEVLPATPQELEVFLSANPVEEKAALSLRTMDPRAQKIIINRGSLAGARNTTACLIGRFSLIHKHFPELSNKRAFDDDGMEGQPRKRRSKAPCWFWDHGCCEKDNCPYAHTGPPAKEGVIDITEPCWYFVRGLCTKGEKCIFPHTTPEQDFARMLMERLPAAQQAQALAIALDPTGLALAQYGEDRVQIPSQTARTIIGVGGNNMQLFTQATGCQIQIDREVVNGMQTATISGTLSQIQVAKAFLEQQAETDTFAAKGPGSVDPTDELSTAVKVALQSAKVPDMEEPPEVSKIMKRITNVAKSAAEGVDTSGRSQPLDEIVPQITRNFFSGVCSSFADRLWLSKVDFQLVLESTLKEHLPHALLSSVTQEALGELIWANHDLVLEEQRFLPAMYDLVRAVVDGPKMKKKVYKAFEVGRLSALCGNEQEGTGIEYANAEIFLNRWVGACLDHFAEEGNGDPENVFTKEEVIKVFTTLLAAVDSRGGCTALPARWSAEVGVPAQGWGSILETAYDNKLLSLKQKMPPPISAPAAVFNPPVHPRRLW